ncbi:MAG: hypothetical protein HFJ34_05750 [Clostridia bacterium]|nr:hypothetical protein [Clostridia bacterium]
MKRKEMIDKLKQDMPNFYGNDEENEIKRALYLYVELGKMKSFDENYYFGNSQTRRRIYDLAEKLENNIEEIARKRKIICVSLTHLYCNIAREFGIYAVASSPEEGGHINPIVRTKNRGTFVADLQLDLENIQTKSRLQHFEYKGNLSKESKERFDKDTITQMLIEIGYIKDEREYKDEEVKKLKEKAKEKNPHEALKIVLEDEGLYRGNEDMESIEIDKFYRGMLKGVLPHFMGKKVFVFNCYRENEEKQRDYTLCAFSEEDGIRPYIFSKRDRRFLKVDIPKLKELQESGLKFGARQKENGAKKLQKYINQQTQKEKERIDLNK